MSEARPLPEEPEEAPAPLSQPRGGRKLEVWFDLLDRLAERRNLHEAGEAARQAQPPTKAQLLLDRAVWRVILFARWLRPHLARNAVAAQKVTRKTWRRSLLQFQRQTQETRKHVYGWLLWQLRLLRTDPDRKLAALGLAGGFVIPMVLIVTLGHLIPASPAITASEMAATAPYSDPSVPAPAVNVIEAAPGEPPIETPLRQDAEVALILPPPVSASEPLTIKNFRFEYFILRDKDGRLQLLSHAAEAMILASYPVGSRAVDVMRFFGDVMLRAGSEQDSANRAAQARCMALPVNKVFPVKTVTCTYGHDVPMPRHARESERTRIFWIMALSYDRNGRLLDLRLHARPTMATLN